MAVYVGEEEVWKCQKHPSKRRHHRNGICPTCLRESLGKLCPDCAKPQPCSCSSSSSSSSSSAEPSLRRSRSVAVPFLRRPPSSGFKTPSFLSSFLKKKKKEEVVIPITNVNNNSTDDDGSVDSSKEKIEDFARMMMRSRSVNVGSTRMASGDVRSGLVNGKSSSSSWHLPSPMKVFRSSKTPKTVDH